MLPPNCKRIWCRDQVKWKSSFFFKICTNQITASHCSSDRRYSFTVYHIRHLSEPSISVFTVCHNDTLPVLWNAGELCFTLLLTPMQFSVQCWTIHHVLNPPFLAPVSIQFPILPLHQKPIHIAYNFTTLTVDFMSPHFQQNQAITHSSTCYQLSKCNTVQEETCSQTVLHLTYRTFVLLGTATDMPGQLGHSPHIQGRGFEYDVIIQLPGGLVQLWEGV